MTVLNSTTGTADTIIFEVEQQGIALTWNISISLTNETRTIRLTDATFEEHWLFIPNPNTPYTVYTFTVTDMVGITDGYLETLIPFNGTNTIVERQALDMINPTPFYMQWATRYQIRLQCEKGTYTYNFIALTEYSQSFIITKDMFPITYEGQNLTVKAERLTTTHIQINYTDNEALTLWVQTQIKHRNGNTYTTDYTTNNTGNTQQINWNNADNETDYIVYVTAQRTNNQYIWIFSCPTPIINTNPWNGLFEVLGTFPFDAQYIIAFGVILTVLGISSYYYMAVSMMLAFIFTAFFCLINWLSIPIALLGVAAFIVVLTGIAEAKKREREI
jgi:hypothetical protein